MHLRFKIAFLILLVFFPLLISVPGTSKNQSISKVDSYQITFNPDVAPVKLTYSQSAQNGNVNFFYSYLTNKTLTVSNSTVNSVVNFYSNVPSTTEMINLTLLTKSFAINDFNYFISNNSQFVMFSTFSTNNGYQVSIFDLANFNNFIVRSNTSYKLGTIVNFGNSSDVYFSFYNTTMFSIVRYDFATNLFSFFFNSTNLLNKNISIIRATEFTLNNELYVSITRQNLTNYANTNTSIFILGSNIVFYNLTFTGLNINTFTPFDYGLILYSMTASTYYKYFFSTGLYSSFLPPFGNYYNVTELAPFDSNSFILLNFNSLAIVNIQDQNNANSFSIAQTFDLNQNPLSVQAFVIQGQQFFLLSGLDNYNQIDFSLQDLYTAPTPFLQTTSSLPYYSTTSFLPADVGTSNVNTSFAVFAIFFTIFVLGIGAIVVLVALKNNSNNRYRPRYPPGSNSYLTRDQYTSQVRNNSNSIYKNSYCSNCGTLIQPGDVFCQNCGFRI